MSTKKPMILVADDDAAMLKLLSRVLELEGYHVVTARDGTTALKLAVKEKSLALAILELEATEQRGIQICRQLREFSGMPIIILAAKYEERDIVQGLEAGADDFIKKPISMVEFVARVKATLRRQGFPVKFNLSI